MVRKVMRFLLDERGNAEGNTVGAIGLILVLLLFVSLLANAGGLRYLSTNIVNHYQQPTGAGTAVSYTVRTDVGQPGCNAWYHAPLSDNIVNNLLPC